MIPCTASCSVPPRHEHDEDAARMYVDHCPSQTWRGGRPHVRRPLSLPGDEDAARMYVDGELIRSTTTLTNNMLLLFGRAHLFRLHVPNRNSSQRNVANDAIVECDEECSPAAHEHGDADGRGSSATVTADNSSALTSSAGLPPLGGEAAPKIGPGPNVVKRVHEAMSAAAADSDSYAELQLYIEDVSEKLGEVAAAGFLAKLKEACLLIDEANDITAEVLRVR